MSSSPSVAFCYLVGRSSCLWCRWVRQQCASPVCSWWRTRSQSTCLWPPRHACWSSAMTWEGIHRSCPLEPPGRYALHSREYTVKINSAKTSIPLHSGYLTNTSSSESEFGQVRLQFMKNKASDETTALTQSWVSMTRVSHVDTLAI